ncbi:MAG TPA: Asd/ArgC dimerization domain-containing protein [Terriglobia bacterium]|nr:Asd/ArgC dimerization domain-containing protein [Terriglobia bacterium]
MAIASQTGEWSICLLGASTLQGKEVKAVLEESHAPIKRLLLLDAEDWQGSLTEFDGEPAVVQAAAADAFEGIGLAMFASDAALTQQHWRQAQAAGCRIIDLSYGLEAEPGACIAAPLLEDRDPDMGTPWRSPAVLYIAAHPMALALAGILNRISRRSPIVRAAATLFEPASERGQPGVAELHEQTVSLLSFHEIPRTVFDAQVSFNLLACNGPEARPTLREIQERIARHTAALLRPGVSQPSMRLVQAPVFHGYSFSCWLELAEPLEPPEIAAAMQGEPFTVCPPGDSPSAVSTAGSNTIALAGIDRDAARPAGYWLWGAFDNLRLAARNAVCIAGRAMQASPSEGLRPPRSAAVQP